MLYKGLLYKLLLNADVVADRFHVTKIVNQDLDTARKASRKANQENPNQVERNRVEAALKQGKYALLKLEENLTQKQRDKLEEIREVCHYSLRCTPQKEAFRALFEQAESWGDGDIKITGLVS